MSMEYKLPWTAVEIKNKIEQIDNLEERVITLENGDKLYAVRAYIHGDPLVSSYDDPKKIGTEDYTVAEDYIQFQVYTEEKITSKAPTVVEFLHSCECGAYYLESRRHAVQINGWFGSNYDQEYFDTPLRFYCTEIESGFTFYIDYERTYTGGEETVVWFVPHEEVGNYITIETEEL